MPRPGACLRPAVPALSVLVIEGNADLHEMYSAMLREAGYVVRGARCAGEAVAAIVEARPDVAVLALGISGGVARVLEALGPPVPPALPARSRSVPLVLASGIRDLPELAGALGAVFVAKPFGRDELLQAVQRAIAN